MELVTILKTSQIFVNKFCVRSSVSKISWKHFNYKPEMCDIDR